MVVLIGRYVLTPLFRLLAQSGAREAMTAAALLVVLGAGTLMLEVGMSMALGAFLAGVVLSESSFRHEIEANIDAFRGLLLALFFMSVGMAVDLNVVLENAPRLIGATLLVTLAKAVFVWAVFRVNCKTESEAVRSASVLTPAGEFSFVLFPLGLSLGLLTQHQTDMLVAVAVMTMLLGPPVAALGERLARRLDVPAEEPDAEEDFSGANGSVLVVGFGRFGQIVSQCLLAQGMEVTIIDNDVEMIQSAGRFGFRIYYGDGTRLDVLRAAGAERARVIAICVDRRETTDRIVDILSTNVPDARLHVRSYDRVHTLALQAKGVDYEIRETFEIRACLRPGDAARRRGRCRDRRKRRRRGAGARPRAAAAPGGRGHRCHSRPHRGAGAAHLAGQDRPPAQPRSRGRAGPRDGILVLTAPYEGRAAQPGGRAWRKTSRRGGRTAGAVPAACRAPCIAWSSSAAALAGCNARST